MKVLKHLVFLVAVIITGRADEIPDRTRRDGNQIPVGGKVGAYGSSSVNPSTDAQLSNEILEGGANKHYSMQTPNSFGGLNEAGVSFGAEAKAEAGYDGEGQLLEGNIVDDYGLAPLPAGVGYGNQFKIAAQASTSAEVQTGETVENGETAQADATAQAKLQAQFGQEAQHGADTQEKQGVQYDEGNKVQKQYHPVMSLDELMNHGSLGPIKYSYDPEKIIYKPGQGLLNNPGRGIWSHYSGTTPPTDPLGGTFIGIPQVDTDPSSTYYNGPPVYQYAQPAPPIIDTGLENVKPMANGYEVGDSKGMDSKYDVRGSVTKGDAQTSEGMKYIPKYRDSSPYVGTGIYNDGFPNGEIFQANSKSHLQSGVQFGGAVAEASSASQASSVIETRFGQSTRPPRRPMPGFGYRQPYSGWKSG